MAAAIAGGGAGRQPAHRNVTAMRGVLGRHRRELYLLARRSYMPGHVARSTITIPTIEAVQTSVRTKGIAIT